MIRRYEENDLSDLLDVWYAAAQIAHLFLDEAFFAQERKDITEIYLPNAETWVYERNAGVVAFIALLGNEVGGIFVNPERQRQGIGRALLDHARELRDRLEAEVFKENALGRAFYDKYGFKILNEHIHEGTDHEVLRMGLEC